MIDTTGFKLIRCDRYTPQEFAKMFTFEGSNEPSYNCQEYMRAHPKKIYNTDDEIEVLHMKALVGCFRSHRECAVLSDDISYIFANDPMDEIAVNYDELSYLKEETLAHVTART